MGDWRVVSGREGTRTLEAVWGPLERLLRFALCHAGSLPRGVAPRRPRRGLSLSNFILGWQTLCRVALGLFSEGVGGGGDCWGLLTLQSSGGGGGGRVPGAASTTQ